MTMIPFVLTIVVLGLFDHYIWSLWAGQALVAFTLGLGGDHIKKSPNGDSVSVKKGATVFVGLDRHVIYNVRDGQHHDISQVQG